MPEKKTSLQKNNNINPIKAAAGSENYTDTTQVNKSKAHTCVS